MNASAVTFLLATMYLFLTKTVVVIQEFDRKIMNIPNNEIFLCLRIISFFNFFFNFHILKRMFDVEE